MCQYVDVGEFLRRKKKKDKLFDFQPVKPINPPNWKNTPNKINYNKFPKKPEFKPCNCSGWEDPNQSTIQDSIKNSRFF
jgi:hypothetical protein